MKRYGRFRYRMTEECALRYATSLSNFSLSKYVETKKKVLGWSMKVNFSLEFFNFFLVGEFPRSNKVGGRLISC